MSQYTGRIHLYSCIHGTDSRPRPLFHSFQPEELDLHDSLILIDIEDMPSTILRNNAAFRQVVVLFLSQWHKLRPIHRKKLLGKPLQLPLAIELCCLTEGANHDMEVDTAPSRSIMIIGTFFHAYCLPLIIVRVIIYYIRREQPAHLLHKLIILTF